MYFSIIQTPFPQANRDSTVYVGVVIMGMSDLPDV